jgi:hypothetical protein
MADRTELKITWDGPIKGLDKHRLSLNAFSLALVQLVAAARRIASNLATNAAEPSESGRLAAAARNLDIEITGIVEGSSGINALLTFEAPNTSQVEMFNAFAENVGIELLESIRAESEGKQRNAAVRKYLQALPEQLTRQEYNLCDNGRTIRDVSFGKMDLPKLMLEPLPFLIETHGKITGVGFEPRWEVKVKGEGANQVTAMATENQVNMALDMRSRDIRALFVSSTTGNRLLVIEDEKMQLRRPTLDQIFDRWDETFRALA